jgi:hypothetical protein
MICAHESAVQIGRDYGYSAPVTIQRQNPAAHGCITITEECRTCGVRRAANVNGGHVERGPWGPSRAEQRDALVAREWDARRALPGLRTAASEAAVTMSRGDVVLHLSIDDEGYIVCRGVGTDAEHASAMAAWTEGVEIGCRLRQALADIAAPHREVR